jgi:hypothetical protein
MTLSRFFVAAFLLLMVLPASGDCLTPAWERIPPLPPAGNVRVTMVVDDFDSDGMDDAVFVRTGIGDTATFQRGKGNGFFASPVDIYTTSPADIHTERKIHDAIAKDLNRDGKLDLLLVENHARLVFLPGNGDGTFASPVFSTAAVGELFAIADLTGDDVEDVAAFYYNATAVGVVLFAGTASGTFAEVTRTPLPAPPYAIATGDLDGDGANDLVVGSANGTNLDLLFGNDDGTFDPAVPQASGDSWATAIKLADLDNDGDLDIVAASSFDRIAVHRNRGGRTFDAATIYVVSEPYTSVKHQVHLAVADVTGDGQRDLLVTTSNNALATLRGRGDATFDTPRFELFSASSVTDAPLDTTDFDGDGRIDVIIGKNGFEGFQSLRNRCGDLDVFLTATPPANAAEYNVTVHVSTHGYDDGLEEPPPVHATGTVSILEGATVLATGTLSNGELTLNVRGLTRGAHKLVARYSGDDQYEPAQSARILVRVPFVTTPPPPRRRAVRR